MGRVRSCWCAIAVALLIAGASGGGGAARAEDLAPATAKGEVSIQFPKSWQVNNKDGKSLMSAMAPQPDKDDTGSFRANFEVSVRADSKIDGAALQAGAAAKFSDYKVVEPPVPVTVNGLQGVTFGGTFSYQKLALRSRQYVFTFENKLYVVTFTTLESTWDKARPLVEKVVDTLTVKKG